MSKFVKVWTFNDLAAREGEVIAAGRQFGVEVRSIVVDAAKANDVIGLGADKAVVVKGLPEGAMLEDCAATIAKAITADELPAVLVMPASVRCKAIAAKVAKLTNAGIVNEVTEINDDTFTHLVYGGLALSAEKVESTVAIITMAPGAYAALEADASRSGDVIDVDFVAPAVGGVTRVGVTKKEAGSVDLGRAKRVVGVGRGFSEKEQLQLAEGFAKAMGAELGCSRPIAEGEQWMERERYIGVSGVMLKPEVYVAVGVSGQIQHMVGVNTANTIFAINKDKKAPVFKYADYGIVGDLKVILPKLQALLA